MRRISDPASHEFDIVHKEMANPTGLLADALRDSLEPLREALSSIVRELLGPEATEQQVKLCRMSMMAQCFGPMLRQRRNESFCPSHPSGGDPLFKDVALLTDHVVRFSLAGIREMARRVKAGQAEARADPKGDRE
jgi:hypothetical protein